jgi:hypothetical protein
MNIAVQEIWCRENTLIADVQEVLVIPMIFGMTGNTATIMTIAMFTAVGAKTEIIIVHPALALILFPTDTLTIMTIM